MKILFSTFKKRLVRRLNEQDLTVELYSASMTFLQYIINTRLNSDNTLNGRDAIYFLDDFFIQLK